MNGASTLRIWAPVIVMSIWAVIGACSIDGYLLNVLGVVSIFMAVYLHGSELYVHRYRRRLHRNVRF